MCIKIIIVISKMKSLFGKFTVTLSTNKKIKNLSNEFQFRDFMVYSG